MHTHCLLKCFHLIVRFSKDGLHDNSFKITINRHQKGPESFLKDFNLPEQKDFTLSGVAVEGSAAGQLRRVVEELPVVAASPVAGGQVPGVDGAVAGSGQQGL